VYIRNSQAGCQAAFASKLGSYRDARQIIKSQTKKSPA
jgi:hypothetical protein